ncbi:ABC transporter permease [Phosphitispora sp. TUW77]|uniref:ABC transporter permease n=1 Tax=Phosphitispora sp. TUW77 TaxID=3152361 RepID=UPI003AB17658
MMITELWTYRKFIFSTAVNDIRYRYAGSMFGVFWNVFNPLAQIIVYTFVFSQIMVARLPELESTFTFAIYLCSGLLPWISYSETILRGTTSLIENSTYLKKLPIPEQIFVAQTTISSTLSLGISMILLLLISIVLQRNLALSWISLPVVLMLFQGSAFGISLTLSCLNVFFRDIGQLMGIALQMWMWMTPIVYVKDILPLSFQKLIMLNPASQYIEALHGIVVFGEFPAIYQWLYMLSFTTFFILLGLFIMHILRKEIRDVL